MAPFAGYQLPIQYKSGIIKERGSFLKDQKNGVWCQYDTLGTEIECIEYKKGIRK